MKKEIITEIDKIYTLKFDIIDTEEDGYINIYDEFEMPLILENIYEIKNTKNISLMATTDKIFIISNNDFKLNDVIKHNKEFENQKQLYITKKYNFLRDNIYPNAYLDLYNDTEEISVLGLPSQSVLDELNKYKNVSLYLDEEDCLNTLDNSDFNIYSFHTDERYEQKEFEFNSRLTPDSNLNIIPYYYINENKNIKNKYIIHNNINEKIDTLPPINIIMQSDLKKRNYLIKFLEEFNIIWDDEITFNDLTICSILDCNINNLKFDKTKVFFYCTDNTKEYARNFVDKYLNFDYNKIDDFKGIRDYNCPKMIILLTDEWEDKYEKLNFIDCPKFVFYFNFFNEDVILNFNKIKNKNFYTDPINNSDTKHFNISDFIKKENKVEYNILSFEEYDDFIYKHPNCDFLEIKDLLPRVNTIFLGDTMHKYYIILYSLINYTTIFFRNNFEYIKFIKKYFNYSQINPIILKKIKFASQKGLKLLINEDIEQNNLIEDINNYFLKSTLERIDKFNKNSKSIKYFKKDDYNKDELIEEQWIFLYDNEVFIKDFNFENCIYKKYIFSDKIRVEENRIFHKKNNKKMKEKKYFEIVEEKNREDEVKNSIKELKKICDNPTLAEPLMQNDITLIKQKIKIKTVLDILENVVYHICMHGRQYFLIREYLNYLEKYLFEKKILFKKDVSLWQNLKQKIIYNKNKNLIKPKKPCLYISIYYHKISVDKIKSLFKLCYYPIFRYTYDFELLEKIDNSIEDIFNKRLICFDFTRLDKIDFVQLSKFTKLCSYIEQKTGCVSHIITNHEKLDNLLNIYENVYSEEIETNYSKKIVFNRDNIITLKKMDGIDIKILREEIDKIINIDNYTIYDKNKIEKFREQELLNKGCIICNNPEEYKNNIKMNTISKLEQIYKNKNNKQLINIFLEITYTKTEKINVNIGEIVDFETRDNDNNIISI